MKTTNYLISKQLFEAGFEAEFDYCYRKEQPERGLWSKSFEITCWDHEDISRYFPSYDLETILSALPKFIVSDQKLTSPAFIVYGKHKGEFLECHKQENESLADIAAKLWLKLKKENLV